MPFEVTTNPIQGKDVYLMFSDDTGTTWYYLICLIKQSFKFSRGIKKTATQCGPLIGVSAAPDLGIDFEGAENLTIPATAAGIGYASAAKLKTWANSATALMVKQVIGDGSTYKNAANCYIETFDEDQPIDDVVSFNGSLALWGTWTFV